MIVADANILAYLYLPGESTSQAEALLQDDPEWAAPVLWRSEFRNTLTGYVRRGDLTLDQVCEIQGMAESFMGGREYDVNSTQVLTLSRAHGCSAYDCEYVALAITLGTRLVTRDQQILRAFPGVAVAL